MSGLLFHALNVGVSVAPIIGLVILKTIYQLYFCILVSDQHHERKATDREISDVQYVIYEV